MKPAVVRLLEQRVVELARVEPADGVLVRQEQLRAREAHARAAPRDDGDLAEAHGVDGRGRDEEGVGGGGEEHC